MTTEPAGSAPSDARGQTLPDFTVGVALFLLVISFVVLFVPQLSLPYADQEQAVVVERAAADLEGTLLANESAGHLDEHCTLVFFNETVDENDPACPFDSSAPVTEQLGIAPTYSLNVTLRDVPGDDPESQVCLAEGDYESIADCESGAVRLVVGPAVPDSDETVAIARRRVSVGGTGMVLEVGVW